MAKNSYRVIEISSKDVNSVNIEVFNSQDKEVAYGSYNKKTNTAFIYSNNGDEELEDFLVKNIENKKLKVQ